MERYPMSGNLAELSTDIARAIDQLDIASDEAELTKLQAEMQSPDFWADQARATSVSQREARLRTRVETWRQLEQEAATLSELSQSDDGSLTAEINAQTEDLASRLEELKQELKFDGPYDDHDAIVSIYAGAGGNDAKDWAMMLQRMYTRWAEDHGAKVELLDIAPDDEAGIKNVTLKISGVDHLYGKLRGEHGVHRMVRKSPFNSAGSRETSFARVDVLPVIDQPQDVEIDDKDLRVDTFRAQGHGGQSVNTTDSAVRITHLPTGITVSIQNERSQLQNKETALGILRAKLAQLQQEQHAASLAEIKGPTSAAEWGSQIRNYVLDDRIVKDLRTGYESHDPQKILDGGLDPLISSVLDNKAAN